jgi:hypothetical protein
MQNKVDKWHAQDIREMRERAASWKGHAAKDEDGHPCGWIAEGAGVVGVALGIGSGPVGWRSVFSVLQSARALWWERANPNSRKHPVMKGDYLQSRRLTPLEVGIWISALIVAIILGILFITKVVGTWVVFITAGLAMGVGLMRYRAETEQKKRDADDQGE